MNTLRMNYTECPVCNAVEIEKVLDAIDYTVSSENFEIWQCNGCSFRFTQGIPNAENIGTYYQAKNYISHSDTQEGLIYKIYHLVRTHTLKLKRKLIESVTGKFKGNLLDVGAGTGAFAKTMQNAGWLVIGLEPDDGARRNALEKNGLNLLTPDNLYNLETASLDVITMWHVLEHVHDLHGYFDKYYSVLKPDGKLIIAVPNYTSFDAEFYNKHWAAYDVPRHLYHFSPYSMDVLAEAKGFQVIAIQPMWFDSFYVSMLSEQYKSSKNRYLQAFWSGFVSNLKTIFDHKKCSSIIYILEKK